MSLLFRYLTDDGLVGDGSNQDISGAADVHWIAPAADEIWDIARVIINIRDAGSVNADTFGALTALTNGCLFQVKSGATGAVVDLDLLDGTTIKNNGDLARHCYDMDIATATAGDKAVTARWTFEKNGKPLTLNGGRGERLVFTTQDVTTDLTEFTIMAQGVKRN